MSDVTWSANPEGKVSIEGGVVTGNVATESVAITATYQGVTSEAHVLKVEAATSTIKFGEGDSAVTITITDDGENTTAKSEETDVTVGTDADGNATYTIGSDVYVVTTDEDGKTSATKNGEEIAVEEQKVTATEDTAKGTYTYTDKEGDHTIIAVDEKIVDVTAGTSNGVEVGSYKIEGGTVSGTFGEDSFTAETDKDGYIESITIGTDTIELTRVNGNTAYTLKASESQGEGDDEEKETPADTTVYAVSGDKFNFSINAVDGYTIDGKEGTTGQWTAAEKTGATHGAIKLIGAKNIDSNGFNLTSSEGGFTFKVNTSLVMTFTETNGKAVVITASDGGTVNGGDENADSEGLTGKQNVIITAGTYLVKGTTTSSSKIKTLEFTSLSDYWTSLKASVNTADYWGDTSAITTALGATPSTDAGYLTAISTLNTAIAAATPYVAPTSIIVKNGEDTVADASTVTHSNVNDNNSLTLTASFGNTEATGIISWSKTAIAGSAISADSVTLTPTADGTSVEISGLATAGTITITAKDTDERTGASGVSFTLTVVSETAEIGDNKASDTITASSSKADTKVGETITLTATVTREYTETVTYAWYKGDDNKSFATGKKVDYTVGAADSEKNVVTFKVVATGATSGSDKAINATTSVSVAKFETTILDWKKGDGITTANSVTKIGDLYYQTNGTVSISEDDTTTSEVDESGLLHIANGRIAIGKTTSADTSDNDTSVEGEIQFIAGYDIKITADITLSGTNTGKSFIIYFDSFAGGTKGVSGARKSLGSLKSNSTETSLSCTVKSSEVTANASAIQGHFFCLRAENGCVVDISAIKIEYVTASD